MVWRIGHKKIKDMNNKRCIKCNKDILAIAKKCEYCGEWQDETEVKRALKQFPVESRYLSMSDYRALKIRGVRLHPQSSVVNPEIDKKKENQVPDLVESVSDVKYQVPDNDRQMSDAVTLLSKEDVEQKNVGRVRLTNHPLALNPEIDKKREILKPDEIESVPGAKSQVFDNERQMSDAVKPLSKEQFKLKNDSESSSDLKNRTTSINTSQFLKNRKNTFVGIAVGVATIIVGVMIYLFLIKKDATSTQGDSYDTGSITSVSASSNSSKKRHKKKSENYKTYEGYINNKYKVHMEITDNEGPVSGSYYYTKIGSPSNQLRLEGDCKDGRYTLTEYDGTGTATGQFIGVVSGNVIKGTFTNLQESKVMPFEVSENGMDDPISNSSVATGKKYVVINAVSLRLRLGPSLDSSCLTWSDGTNRHPEKGEKFEYINEYPDFYEINYYGYDVFVAKQFTYLVWE